MVWWSKFEWWMCSLMEFPFIALSLHIRTEKICIRLPRQFHANVNENYHFEWRSLQGYNSEEEKPYQLIWSVQFWIEFAPLFFCVGSVEREFICISLCISFQVWCWFFKVVLASCTIHSPYRAHCIFNFEIQLLQEIHRDTDDEMKRKNTHSFKQANDVHFLSNIFFTLRLFPSVYVIVCLLLLLAIRSVSCIQMNEGSHNPESTSLFRERERMEKRAFVSSTLLFR